MARYGEGSERFNASASRWQAGLSQYEEMLRKEQAVANAARETAGYETEGARAAAMAARARAEGADLAERAAAASKQSAQAANLEAEAIQRAAVAREQANSSASRALVPRREFIPGALGGGPLEGQYPYAPRSQATRYPTNIQEVNPFATGMPGWNQGQAAEREAQAARLATAQIEAQRVAASGASQSMAQFAERELAVAAATNRAAVIQHMYSDEMHRHGALTAEFIQATARGEVTLREFGNEMLVTIGKFAGWTAAASAVYGAFRIISDIRTGAVAAQSAVEGLSRFIEPLDKGRAYQGILGLSRQTNVPVQDVGDVAQVFARRFHDPVSGLTDTLTATRTALLAYKLDQISAADSTRFLMAITQEWGISAQRLPGLFDQISAAQRRYGARVAETLPALARSSAAVKNQGGDLNQLLALLALAQVRSGQTGAVVGQAVTRSASNFFRRADNVAIERSYGLNPEEGYTQFLIDAIRKAQTLNGRQRAELGKAIGGPAFGARIFQTLLNAPEAQLNKFLGGTSPETTRGSAAQELSHVLDQADQQLKKIGNTLQRIGGYLSQSGLLTFAGLLLHGLNGALGAVESLLRLFSGLPAPLSTSLGLLGEMAVAMRLLGRFGVGQRLQQIPILGALVQPGARLRQQAITDQSAVTEATKRQLEADAANAYTARRQSQHFLDRARPSVEDATARLQSGVKDPRERALLQDYIAGIHRQAIAQNEVANLAEADVVVSKQRLAAEEENLAAIKASSARNIEATLAQRNLTVSPLRGAVPPGELPLPVTGTQFLAQTEERGALVTNSARGARASEAVARRVEQAAPALAYLGASGRALDVAGRRTAEFAGRAVTSVERGAASLRGAAGRLAGVAAALGPLDYALVGFVAYEEISHLFNESARKTNAAIKRTEGYHPESTDDLKHVLSQPPKQFGALSAYFARLAEFQKIDVIQAREQAAGKPVSQRLTGDLVGDINNSANAARAGLLSQGQITAALKKYGIEVRTAYEPTKGDVAAMRAALSGLASASKNIGDYAESLKGLSDADLTKAVSGTAAELQQFGPATTEGKQALVRLRQQYQYATQRWGAGGDKPNLSALAAARQQFLNSATQSAQSAVQDGLLLARTEADRGRAFDQAARILEQQLTTPARSYTVGGEHGTARATTGRQPVDNAAAQTLRTGQAQQRDQRFQDEEAGRQAALALAQSRTVDQTRNSRLAVESARRQVEATRSRYGTESRQYEQALTALNQARSQQATAMLAQIQAEGTLLQAQAGNDPQKQAQAAVASAQRALSYMRSHSHDFDPTAVLQARATLIQAENQLADQVRQSALDLIQLRGEIATARAHGDPVAQAHAALQFAQAERARARTPKERLQATLDLINANNQLQDAVNSREQERFTYLESLTTDPVKQAGLEVQRTALALKNAQPGTAAFYQAQTQYHQALQNQHQARLSAQESDIDFQLQMEQITRDDAINRYQQLLKLHDLTKQERRDVLLKIHQLQQQAANDANGFALRVGNVKLPTIYDVHRAIGEARRGGDGGAQAVFHNTVHMSVAVSKGADVQDVFNELDRQLGTSVVGQMRSAGLV